MNHEHWYIHINYKHIELQSIKAKVHVTNIIQYSKKKYSYIHRRRDLRINKSTGNVNNDTDDNNNTLIGCTL